MRVDEKDICEHVRGGGRMDSVSAIVAQPATQDEFLSWDFELHISTSMTCGQYHGTTLEAASWVDCILAPR